MKDEPSVAIHEAVYRSLRSKIMFGEIEPGRVFSIRGLATEFKVSMTPIREATRRLVAEGALTMSNSGRISAPLNNSIRREELLSIRLLLEPELAVRAVPRVHSALIERLSLMKQLILKMIKTENSEGYIRTNIEFHKTLYLRAQAPAMLALLETVWLQSGPTMAVTVKKDLNKFSTSYHSDILSALRVGNRIDLVQSIKDTISINSSISEN